MAALLSHHGTQTFEDLAKEVPAMRAERRTAPSAPSSARAWRTPIGVPPTVRVARSARRINSIGAYRRDAPISPAEDAWTNDCKRILSMRSDSDTKWGIRMRLRASCCDANALSDAPPNFTRRFGATALRPLRLLRPAKKRR
jgi:hypothetical protein